MKHLLVTVKGLPDWCCFLDHKSRQAVFDRPILGSQPESGKFTDTFTDSSDSVLLRSLAPFGASQAASRNTLCHMLSIN